MRLTLKYLAILTAGFLLALLPLQADPVDAQRASEVARAFFRNDRNIALRLAPLQPVERAAVPLTKAAEEELPFHIFNRAGGGFVIVAADDACNPILGYSFTNAFGRGADMPAGLSDWLDDLADQVALAREASSAERAKALRKWDAVFVQTKAGEGYKPVVVHETPLWGQRTPFNDRAPEVGGKRSAAGCVPLAMSMLARFFCYPEAGKGVLPTYTYTTDSKESITIPAYTLGEKYDWAHIKMDYRDGYTAEEAAAVSQLVYECGVMVQAKFDASSTSANTFNMARKAIEYMGYDAAATGYYRSYFSDEAWLGMLKAELQNHPLLYSAHREDESGHSFLVDGYDEQGFLRINWGWNGDSNGYFALSAFVPNPDRKYVLDHGAVFGLVPDRGGVSAEYLYLLSGTSSSGIDFKGLETDGPVVPRKDFKMKVGGICNGGNAPFTGYFIVALTDAEGHIKDFVCGSQFYDTTNPRSWRGYPSISCVLNTYPAEGDRLRAFYRGENWGENQWTPFLYDKTDGTVGEILVYDNQTLAEATRLSYGKLLKLVNIDTKDRVEWELKASDGKAVTGCVNYSGTSMTIDASSLKGGYTLTLKRGSDQCSITLTF